METGLGILIGGLITWAVAWCYFKKGADSIRWEARASHMSELKLKVLVAYYRWGQHLRKGQSFTLSSAGNFSLQTLKEWFSESGLMNYTHCSSISFDQETKTHTEEESYESVLVSREGQQLAEYLMRHRGFNDDVECVYACGHDGGLRELIWSKDPTKELGPLGARAATS
jgi:hypothetical protein